MLRRQFRREGKAGAHKPKQDESVLHHIVVTGGSLEEWQNLDVQQWLDRLGILARAVKASGAGFITVYPHEVGARATRPVVLPEEVRNNLMIDGVVVIADPQCDGRERLCSVLGEWDASQEITELSLDAALFGTAGEPDLVIVFGPPDRLPRSLMWELAYSEIVFVSSAWADVCPSDIETAISEFGSRQRRFGGVDP